jgi:hypothetical protein
MAGELQRIAELGRQLRVDSIRCTTAAESGHPTSSMSAADLMAVLLVKSLKYDWDHPGHPNNDRLAEGSIWEAFDEAGHYQLSNLIAILDMNRLGQRGPTELGWDAPVYAARARAFGWHAIEIDGHDITAIDAAYTEALAQDEKPTCVVAKTVKGSGVSLVANKDGWHGKALSPAQAREAIKELGGEHHITVHVAKPAHLQPAILPAAQPLTLPVYEVGTEEATRKAFGDALVAVGANRPDVVVLDGEVSNPTFTGEFNKAYPADPHGGRLRRQPSPLRVACRRQHRRGRAVADGPGRLGDDAGRSRQHRAVPVRCQPDGAPGGCHGRSARHLLPANDPRENAGYSAARKVGYAFARAASFAEKALALAGQAARAQPSPRTLPRGADRRPSSDSPPDCATREGLSPFLRTAQYLCFG